MYVSAGSHHNIECERSERLHNNVIQQQEYLTENEKQYEQQCLLLNDLSIQSHQLYGDIKQQQQKQQLQKQKLNEITQFMEAGNS